MRKYVIILLVFLIIFTSSCTKIEKEEPNIPANNVNDDEDKTKDENSNKDDENKESVDWLIEVYKGIYITNGDDIYYIADGYDKLYSIKKDGSEKTLIHEQERMFQVQVYNNILYVYYSVYTSVSGPSSPVIPGKIVTMNKDGSDIKELDLDIEYTKVYYPGGFFIYKDFLVLTVENLDTPYEGMNNLRDYYLYNLKNDKLVDVVKEIDMAYSPIIYNDIFYYNGYGNFDEDSKGNTLHKYNINTGEKSKIEICKTPDSLNWFYKFQIKDNFIYSMNKYGVYKDNLDGKSDTEILVRLKDENKYIVDLNITDKYIFYIIKDDNEIANDEDSLKIIVYRMNHDGTNIKEIYSETQRATNMAPQKVRASCIDDTILIYENRHTNTILYMDLDGNIINITNLANLKAANLGHSIIDGDYIYYVFAPYDKLYRIKKDGSEKTLIYEDERMYNIQIYGNKMYVYLSGILEGRIFGKIITMNKDGTDAKIFEPDFGYPSGYYISEFFIHNDLLFILSYDLSIAEEGDPYDLFKYDLKNGNFSKVSDGKIRSSDYTIDNYTMDLTIRRIKHDGSELKTIYTETTRGTNLPPKAVVIMLEDNALKYRNRISETYKFMDFDGNILE
jgi:hypothetical protein